jgi:hypothetical protein
MDENIKLGMMRWLRDQRKISMGARSTDDDVISAVWQELCDVQNLHDNGSPKFATDGTLIDDRGNRSIFHDVDA